MTVYQNGGAHIAAQLKLSLFVFQLQQQLQLQLHNSAKWKEDAAIFFPYRHFSQSDWIIKYNEKHEQIYHETVSLLLMFGCLFDVFTMWLYRGGLKKGPELGVGYVPVSWKDQRPGIGIGIISENGIVFSATEWTLKSVCEAFLRQNPISMINQNLVKVDLDLDDQCMQPC